MYQFKNQRNGYIGEDRSKANIPKDFWVITRDVDADAADLMVQNAYSDADAARASRAEPLQVASIQAKYFEGTNQVNISKKYVLNPDDTPREGFLAFLHTDDVNEKAVHYLFTASEIKAVWEETQDEESYYFSLKCGRDYQAFRDLETKDIRSKLKHAIGQTTGASMAWGWTESSKTYCSVRHPHCLEPKYRLMRIGEACIAIFEGGYGQLGHPLEMRKDMFASPGTYEWGYEGTGPKLLAASLLTHFLCGRRPNESEIKRVLEHLIGLLKRGEEARFGKEEIFKALAKIPHYMNLAEIGSWNKRYYDTVREYSSYFSDPLGLTGPLEEEQPVLDDVEGEGAPRSS